MTKREELANTILDHPGLEVIFTPGSRIELKGDIAVDTALETIESVGVESYTLYKKFKGDYKIYKNSDLDQLITDVSSGNPYTKGEAYEFIELYLGKKLFL